MSAESYIAGAIILAAGSYLISLEVRVRALQNQLLRLKEQTTDEKITARIKAMSDTALNAALAKDLSSGNGD